jgi:hypothetical protein
MKMTAHIIVGEEKMTLLTIADDCQDIPYKRLRRHGSQLEIKTKTKGLNLVSLVPTKLAPLWGCARGNKTLAPVLREACANAIDAIIMCVDAPAENDQLVLKWESRHMNVSYAQQDKDIKSKSHGPLRDVRFLVNGKWAGGCCLFRHSKALSLFIHNIGKALPLAAFSGGYSDKGNIKVRGAQCLGGFGDGLKMLLRVCASFGFTVYIYGYSPGAKKSVRKYTVTPPKQAGGKLKLRVQDFHSTDVKQWPKYLSSILDAHKHLSGTVLQITKKITTVADMEWLESALDMHYFLRSPGLDRKQITIDLDNDAQLIVYPDSQRSDADICVKPGLFLTHLKDGRWNTEIPVNYVFDFILSPRMVGTMGRDRVPDKHTLLTVCGKMILRCLEKEWKNPSVEQAINILVEQIIVSDIQQWKLHSHFHSTPSAILYGILMAVEVSPSKDFQLAKCTLAEYQHLRSAVDLPIYEALFESQCKNNLLLNALGLLPVAQTTKKPLLIPPYLFPLFEEVDLSLETQRTQHLVYLCQQFENEHLIVDPIWLQYTEGQVFVYKLDVHPCLIDPSLKKNIATVGENKLAFSHRCPHPTLEQLLASAVSLPFGQQKVVASILRNKQMDGTDYELKFNQAILRHTEIKENLERQKKLQVVREKQEAALQQFKSAVVCVSEPEEDEKMDAIDDSSSNDDSNSEEESSNDDDDDVAPISRKRFKRRRKDAYIATTIDKTEFNRQVTMLLPAGSSAVLALESPLLNTTLAIHRKSPTCAIDIPNDQHYAEIRKAVQEQRPTWPANRGPVTCHDLTLGELIRQKQRLVSQPYNAIIADYTCTLVGTKNSRPIEDLLYIIQHQWLTSPGLYVLTVSYRGVKRGWASAVEFLFNVIPDEWPGAQMQVFHVGKRKIVYFYISRP